MSCSEKPFFVIVKKTGQGFNFDNDVIYSSPLATHRLSQATGAMHPSLLVKSDWGLNKRKTISNLITGEAGGATLKSADGEKNIVRQGTEGKTGIIYPKGNAGYVMAKIGKGSRVDEAPSVAELARILSDLSLRTNVNVRGSPIEFKRLLDYIQFMMVNKVTKDSSLYLARPNNYHVMEAVHTDGISLEEAYSTAFRDSNSNSKVYGRAYFVTFDRVAALASIVRGIPTVYQRGKTQSYYNLPITNVVPTIRKIIESMLIAKGYKIPETRTPMNAHSNRIQELITPDGRPVITSGPLFAWFLDTPNKVDNTVKRRIVGTDFHKLTVTEKVLVIFYWVFNYPGKNTEVIEYFLAILDSFHDFTSPRARNAFKNIWPANKKINSSIRNANLKIQQTIKEQIPHFDRIGLDLGYIYDDKAIIKNNLTPKESNVTEYLPSFLPGARFPHMWLNFNQNISSHTLIAYKKWTLIYMNENDLNYFNIDLQPEYLNMVLLRDLKIDFQYLNEFIKFADMDKLGLILIRPDGHIALRALPNKDNKNILTNYFEEIGF